MSGRACAWWCAASYGEAHGRAGLLLRLQLAVRLHRGPSRRPRAAREAALAADRIRVPAARAAARPVVVRHRDARPDDAGLRTARCGARAAAAVAGGLAEGELLAGAAARRGPRPARRAPARVLARRLPAALQPPVRPARARRRARG